MVCMKCDPMCAERNAYSLRHQPLPWLRMLRNSLSFQVFDFQLSDKEMATILSFNRNWRACLLPETVNMEEFPYDAEY